MSSHFSIIPPPFPDPRRWKEIRELQELHQTTDWMTSESYDGLPSTSSIVFNTPHQRSSSAVDVEEYSEENLTYMQYDSGQQATVESSDELLLGDSHCDHYDTADNFTDGCDQHHIINQHGDDGEETEMLQLNEFWIQRLSKTVKRMKQKYDRKQ
jgi:hypothetical protein